MRLVLGQTGLKSMSEHLLRFALQGGRLVHIEEVDRGLACDCRCRACG